MIHTVVKSRNEELWTVGYYRPGSNEWTPIHDFNKYETAIRFVNFLNGGEGSNDWVHHFK